MSIDGTHGVDVSGVIDDRVAHTIQKVSDHVAFAFYVDGAATAQPVAARAQYFVYLLRHLLHTQQTTLQSFAQPPHRYDTILISFVLAAFRGYRLHLVAGTRCACGIFIN